MSTALAAAKRATRLAAAGIEIPDTNASGDPEIDAARRKAINELGRELTCEESFMIAAGHPHDFRPEPLAPDPSLAPTAPDEHPEAALARQVKPDPRVPSNA